MSVTVVVDSKSPRPQPQRAFSVSVIVKAESQMAAEEAVWAAIADKPELAMGAVRVAS